MPTQRAKHPLCGFCGEDQKHMVEATTDGGRARRVVYHCNTCGKSEDRLDDCEHGYWFGCPHCRKAKTKARTVSAGDGFWDGQTFWPDAPADY
jgi:hypothetical protein